MIRHLPIIFSAIFLITMYLPSKAHAGRITPTKTELGENTTASGINSTALGRNTTASGYISTAMGYYTTASGAYSTAMGLGTTAYSAIETVIGRDNTPYTPGSKEVWVGSDRLFVIGNGTNASSSDAMVVLKNGNTGIGTSSPSDKLDVVGHIKVEGDGGWNSAGDEAIVGLGSVLGHFFIKAVYGDGLKLGAYGATDAFVLKQNSGNVGIGTASPGYKLEVNGTAGKPGGGSWFVSSDARLKDISGEYDRGLDQIVSLNPVTFYYKEDNPRGLPTDKEYVGFVAQEVQNVFPEAVSEGPDGYLDFNIHPVNVAVVNAIKELKAENEALRAENSAFRETQRIRFQKQQMEIEKLRSMIKGLKS